jgi:hypothetical protein
VLIVDTWPYSLNQHERFTNDEYEKAVMAVGPSPLDLDHLLEEVAKPLSYWNDGYEVAQTWQRWICHPTLKQHPTTRQLIATGPDIFKLGSDAPPYADIIRNYRQVRNARRMKFGGHPRW